MAPSALPLDIQVIQQAMLWAESQSLWLNTVLRTWGSSPRSPGALMAVNQGGEWCGSLSGGCVEEGFLRQVAEGRWRQPSQVVTYGDGGLTPDVSLPCGGRLEVLVEYLPAGERTVEYLGEILAALQGHQPLKKQLILPGPVEALTLETSGSHPQVEYFDNTVNIWHGAAPRLVVAGWSSVAAYCVQFACALGFEVVVCEPRDEFLRQMAGQIPEGVRVVERLPARYLEMEGCHAHTAIVALTHDARMDDLTMMEAVNTPAFYIGVMGSLRNSQKRADRLRNIGGLNSQELSRLHAPIGIDIGSKTPAEIGLAVMADVVRFKNQIATPGANPGRR